MLTFRWRIAIARLGVVATFISLVYIYGLLEVSFRRVVGAGEVHTGSPDLGGDYGREGYE